MQCGGVHWLPSHIAPVVTDPAVEQTNAQDALSYLGCSDGAPDEEGFEQHQGHVLPSFFSLASLAQSTARQRYHEAMER